MCPLKNVMPRHDRFGWRSYFHDSLPAVPSWFMSSLIESCGAGVFEHFRDCDPRLPVTRPMIKVVSGRPIVNLSLLNEVMRTWGLPIRLRADTVADDKVGQAFGANSGRLIRHLVPIFRFGRAQWFATRDARRATSTLLQTGCRPFESFGAAVAAMQLVYVEKTWRMFNLTGCISLLQSLRRAITPEANGTHLRMLNTFMENDFDSVRAFIRSHPSVQRILEVGEIPQELEFQDLWIVIMDRYGHRAVYEDDLAQPRYAETPKALIAALMTPPRDRLRPRRTLLNRVLFPIEVQTRRLLAEREWFQHRTMVVFTHIRNELLRLADHAVLRGQLPTREALWNLDIDELRRLDQGWQPDEAFWKARAAEIDRLAQQQPSQ